MTPTANQDSSRSPHWLDVGAKLAAIVLAVVAVLGALAATIHFTVQADIGPRLTALETHLTDFEKSAELRFDAIDQRLGRIEDLLEKR